MKIAIHADDATAIVAVGLASVAMARAGIDVATLAMPSTVTGVQYCRRLAAVIHKWVSVEGELDSAVDRLAAEGPCVLAAMPLSTYGLPSLLDRFETSVVVSRRTGSWGNDGRRVLPVGVPRLSIGELCEHTERPDPFLLWRGAAIAASLEAIAARPDLASVQWSDVGPSIARSPDPQVRDRAVSYVMAMAAGGCGSYRRAPDQGKARARGLGVANARRKIATRPSAGWPFPAHQ